MARVTVEDCLEKVDNRFGLIHLAAKRVRQLRKGSEPLVVCKNNDVVVSLREIAAGNVFQVREEDGSNAENAEELSEQTDEGSPSQENGGQEENLEGKS